MRNVSSSIITYSDSSSGFAVSWLIDNNLRPAPNYYLAFVDALFEIGVGGKARDVRDYVVFKSEPFAIMGPLRMSSQSFW